MMLTSLQKKQLIDLLDGRYADQLDSFHVIDCRYGYEFEGGHIPGAENMSSPEALEERFFASHRKPDQVNGQRMVVVFHCEYSVQRAPRM